MSDFYNKYPYTDFHELNLDWVLHRVKDLSEEFRDFININTLKYADPLEWDRAQAYGANTIVVYSDNNTAYLSTRPVPAGIWIYDTDYWTPAFSLMIPQYLMPEMFGAKGDGVTDDSAAFYQFLNECVSRKMTGLLRNTTYYVPGDLIIQGLQLEGSKATILMNDNTILVNDDTIIKNLTIENGKMIVDGTKYRVVNDIKFKNWDGAALTMRGYGNELDARGFMFERNVYTSAQTQNLVVDGSDITISGLSGCGGTQAIVVNGPNCHISDSQLWLNNYNVITGSIFITVHATFVFLNNICVDTYDNIIVANDYLKIAVSNLSIINNNTLRNNFTLKFLTMSNGSQMVSGDVHFKCSRFTNDGITLDLGSYCHCTFDFIDGKAAQKTYYNTAALQSACITSDTVIEQGSYLTANNGRIQGLISFYTNTPKQEIDFDISDMYLRGITYNASINCFVAAYDSNNNRHIINARCEINNTRIKIYTMNPYTGYLISNALANIYIVQSE